MRKTIYIFIMALVLLLAAVPVYATEMVSGEKDSLQPMYTHILLLEAGLAVNSSGKATWLLYTNLNTASFNVDVLKRNLK